MDEEETKEEKMKDTHLSFMRYLYKAVRQQIPMAQALDDLEYSYNELLKEKFNSPELTGEQKETASRKISETVANGGTSDESEPTDSQIPRWLHPLDDSSGDRIQALATRVNVQIDYLSDINQQKKIRNALGTSGSPNDVPSATDVDTASRFLHDEYIRNYESINIIRTMIARLGNLLIIILVFGLVISTLLAIFQILNTDGTPRFGFFPIMYVFVVFFGFFGSVVSNLLKSYNPSGDVGPRIPDEEFQITDEVVSARILLGGAAAAVIYTLILADLFPARLPGETSLILTILVVSFIAGFSDRLLVKSLNMVENQILD